MKNPILSLKRLIKRSSLTRGDNVNVDQSPYNNHSTIFWTTARILARGKLSSSTASRPTPLEVPETLAMIFLYVDPFTLRHSINRVCKLWRIVALHMNPPRLSWTNKTRSIKELLSTMSPLYPDGCASFELDIRLDPSSRIPFQPQLLNAVQHFESLTMLRIFHDCTTIDLEQVLKECHALQSLYIGGGTSLVVSLTAATPITSTDPPPAPSLALVSLVLERLFIEPSSFQNLVNISSTIKDLRLKDLHLQPKYDPALLDFQDSDSGPEHPFKDVQYWYRSGACPPRELFYNTLYSIAHSGALDQLERFQMTFRGDELYHRIHPVELFMLFFRLPTNIIHLVLGDRDMCNFWTANPYILSDGWCQLPPPWPPTVPIPTQITHLEFVKNDTRSLPDVGLQLHEFLCAAGSLRSLVAPRLKYNISLMDIYGAADVLGTPVTGPGPRAKRLRWVGEDQTNSRDTRLWACRNLEKLQVGFIYQEEKREPQHVQGLCSRMLFGYLARVCPELTVLDIHAPALDLKLEGGFCLLATLRRLEVLKIESRSKTASELKLQAPKRQDLEWMAFEAEPRRVAMETRYTNYDDVTARWQSRMDKEDCLIWGARTCQGLDGNNENINGGFVPIAGMDCQDHTSLRYMGCLKDVKMSLESPAKDAVQDRPFCWPNLHTIHVRRLYNQFEDKVTQKQVLQLRRRN
ncbi:hypothetical protein BG004_001099 [Podila humilis]|nr:hypothetical protein BG004_001099 [Podila humilis]